MRVFGLPIPFTGKRQKALSPVGGRGWLPVVRESFSGAWQRNVEIRKEAVLSHHAVFACQTLIASDIAKLRLRLVQRDDNGIWTEVPNRNFRIISKPNSYQTRLQFYESWVLSKLQSGNAYILKERGPRGIVGLHVLDPGRVTPLVSDSGEVFYELSADQLAGVGDSLVVPARDIIHDRFNCLFHPLVGLSPIFASGLAAMQGLAIQNDSTLFFQNGAQPGGILTAPGAISDETAARLKEYWDTNFSGANAGKVAVVGDGLKYEAMRAKAVDSQVIEQLRWSAEVVCGVYHVPAFMIGVGQEPNYNNVQNLTLRYYSQCLQRLIEDIEALLDDGLGLNGDAGTGQSLGTEFDLDDLLRMDTVTQFDVVQKAKGTATLNEARRRVNLGPVDGGDTIYLQQQDHSLAAIAARDEQLIDLVNNPPAPAEAPPANDNLADQANAALVEIYKGLRG
ncbi:phage portal protein [Chelativorans sp. Marseille-P2723]|uniref:phage portal protein n=1 Tax=Chelativorans sp. Marseille-P2723 TaxID=2709133 RepID=UPI0015710F72|nr:phage portal protein [Chelativorans sp. Marseille-P2723]